MCALACLHCCQQQGGQVERVVASVFLSVMRSAVHVVYGSAEVSMDMLCVAALASAAAGSRAE
jgi:hypothetical protein